MTELLIVRVRDAWRLLSAERVLGTFRYRVDAEEAAIRHARRMGGEVRISVQNRHGCLEPLGAA